MDEMDESKGNDIKNKSVTVEEKLSVPKGEILYIEYNVTLHKIPQNCQS